MSPSRRDLMMARSGTTGDRTLQRLVDQSGRLHSDAEEPVTMLRLDALEIDPTIQVRVGGLHRETVETYAEILRNGGEMPPVMVFRDPATSVLRLSDGFHRFEAHRRLGLEEIQAIVRAGDYQAAFEYSEEGNLKHGMRLNKEDRYNLFTRRILRGHDWIEGNSNAAIGKALGVSYRTIGRWRERVVEEHPDNQWARQCLTQAMDGREMDVSNIRRARQRVTLTEEQRAMVAILRHLRKACVGLEQLGFRTDADEVLELHNGLKDDWSQLLE